MGPLLPLLTTADGADFIIICGGDLFFVHNEVFAAQSQVLKQEALNTKVSLPKVAGET